jgi:4-hydroxythreonine-4-phosphate dehydrogenase|tara:strand:+ start:417 stop:1409 length:993 start_codon:yes stop_codon:yes gene_type:complete
VIQRLALTAGEPAGIGPDIVLAVAAQAHDAQLVAIGSEDVLRQRAQLLNLNIQLTPYSSAAPITPHVPGELPLIDIPAAAEVVAGRLNANNSPYVLATLDQAIALCMSGECQAMVTAPLHKGAIIDAGIPFTGHTEYLRAATGAEHTVMLLVNDSFRVALATTHLPLRRVADAVSADLLHHVLNVMHKDLTSKLGISAPRITVLGLNPHAGEGGHLGTEERDIIEPVCRTLREEGLLITGPVPADSAFITDNRGEADAYLAMYHDQGLPIIKSEGFENTVNVTLGLPIIRTSVDHGTALTLAGTGEASASSLLAAINAAQALAKTQGLAQ